MVCATHFCFFKAAVTLSHALFAELLTLLAEATTVSCRDLATSAPLVAAADACEKIQETMLMSV
jgi:hypothetical protein